MHKLFTISEAIWLVYILFNYLFVLFVYKKWGKIGVMMFIPISIILANVQVNKFVVLFGIDATLGNIAYSTIFLVSDILNENYGKKVARHVVSLGFVTMIFSTIVMNLAIKIPASPIDENNIHIAALFTPFIRLTLASLIAYFISSNSDIILYQLIRKYSPSFTSIWIRNNASTLISQVIDSVIFTLIAFYGEVDYSTLLSFMFSTYFLKVFTSIFDTPFLYIATYWKNNNKIREID